MSAVLLLGLCGACGFDDLREIGRERGRAAAAPDMPEPRPVMVPLRGDVEGCERSRTGFLGLGGQEIVATVTNNDVEGGVFTVQYYGRYPGSGERLEGTGSVQLGPRSRGDVRIEIHPSEGRIGGECRLVPPRVQRWQ